MPIVLNTKLEDGIYLAVWEIKESHNELLSLVSSEILTDLELSNIHHPQKQSEFFASRLVLKFLINSLKINYSGIKKTEDGKPFLIDSHWKISVSHTQKYVAAAMHSNVEIGIDLEKKSEKLLKIKHKVFNENELDFAKNDLEKLCILWSAKEAIFKAFGKKKVSFKENISIIPFEKDEKQISGILKNEEIELKYLVSIHKIEECFIVVAKTLAPEIS